jgi:hypothetical protein
MKKLIPGLVKHWAKKYLWQLVFRTKISGAGKQQNEQCSQQLEKYPDIIPQLNVFTTHNEDGILQYLLSKTGTASKFFIDIGSNDCINSNCANLAFHYNWKGIFIDGNSRFINRGKYIYRSYFKSDFNRFIFKKAIVQLSTINQLLEQLSVPETVDLLSIDLDGNDYHIWKALEIIRPKIVVVEVQVEKGMTDFIPPYNEVFELYEEEIPKGASPLSMIELANLKGYQLVAANTQGFNLFFVRNDCMGNLHPLSTEAFSKKFSGGFKK